MKVLKTFVIVCGLGALAAPVFAQGGHDGPRGRGGPSAAGPARGSMRAPAIMNGGPQGPRSWNDFHHDTAPAKVSPHRYGTTNLPRPNNWRGTFSDFELPFWQAGRWEHLNHGGRFGWWWVVGPDWYFYDAPVYPYPDIYTPVGEPFGWWYWCDFSEEYYPYVTTCPVPWESVMPQE
jgi:hypothetical protein